MGFNHHHQRKFNSLLNHHGITDVLDNHTAETAFDQFDNLFSDSYNKAFPIKTKTITEKDIRKPWVTQTLINKIKEREKLHKLASKRKIEWKIYTDFRNRLTTEFRQAKAKYFEEKFERNANNVKKNMGSYQ